MKNIAKQIVIAVFVAVIGFVTAACVEYEQKHDYDFSLNYLPGTWKAYEKIRASEMTVTIVFSKVTNGTITMKITEHYVSHVGGTQVGKTTGYYAIDRLFGLEHHMEGGGSNIYDSDVWERTYTQKEITSLRWNLRTLGKDADLYIQYLIPAGECKCVNCEHFYEYDPDDIYNNGCCNKPDCGSKPQGDLSALLELARALDFKKQK
jgi:hypothetical protein